LAYTVGSRPKLAGSVAYEAVASGAILRAWEDQGRLKLVVDLRTRAVPQCTTKNRERRC
jgi:hypothetical protein